MLALAGWTSLPWLRRIKHPTIVMHGENDPIIPAANARLLTGLIPGARLMIVDCGHLFMLTRARRVAAVAKRFFDQDLDAADQITAGLLRDSVLHRYAQYCNIVRGRLLIDL